MGSQLEVAFKAIDRKDFVRPKHREIAYEDRSLPIGYGQTISQPYTVRFMLRLLHIKKGHHVLDIGSGPGWTTALMDYLVGDSGDVIGIERIPQLIHFGQRNFAKYNFSQAKIKEAGDRLRYPITDEKSFKIVRAFFLARDSPDSYINNTQIF